MSYQPSAIRGKSEGSLQHLIADSRKLKSFVAVQECDAKEVQ